MTEMTAEPTAEGPSRRSDETEEPDYPERTAAAAEPLLNKSLAHENSCIDLFTFFPIKTNAQISKATTYKWPYNSKFNLV